MGRTNAIARLFLLTVLCIVVTSAVHAQELSLSSDSTILAPPSNLDVPAGLNNKADSLTAHYNFSVDSVTTRFNSQVDSLNKLRLSPDEYTRSLDSLYHRLNTSVGRIKQRYEGSGARKNSSMSRLDSLVNRRTSFLDSLLIPSGLQGMGAKPPLPADFNSDLPVISGMPQADFSSAGFKGAPNIPSLKNPVGEVNTKDVNVPDLNGIESGKLQAKMNAVNQYSSELEELSKAKEQLEKKDLDKTIEQSALKLDPVKDVTEETKAADAVRKQAEALQKVEQDPEKLKEEANAAKKEFVDHLAGKEDVVKKDMEDIGKLQLKYRNVSDSRFLPKRLPNEMKGKPFVERLIPGVTFQVFKQENVSVDIAPFIGYRFSGRINAGLGGYRRIMYQEKNDHLTAVDCFGFRLFGSFKVVQSLSAYTETEYFRNQSKPASGRQQLYAPPPKHWKWNIGVQKRYTISKRFFGHFIVMSDLVKIRKFPNTEGAAVRFGVDYQIRANKKKTDK